MLCVSILAQEIQQGEVLRIVLNLVKEYQRIIAIVELVTGNHAEIQVEVFLLMAVSRPA